jgi:hypothetical protein
MYVYTAELVMPCVTEHPVNAFNVSEQKFKEIISLDIETVKISEMYRVTRSRLIKETLVQ